MDARLVRGASMSEESSDYAFLGTRSDSSIFDDVFGKATSRPWHPRTTPKQEIANAEVSFKKSTSSQDSGHSAETKKLLGGKNEPEDRRTKAVRVIQSWARALADERVKHSTCANSRKLHEEVRAWGNRFRRSTDPVIAQQSYEKILAILSLAPTCLRSIPIANDLRVLAPSSTFQFEGTFVVIHLHGLTDFVLAMDRTSARMRFMSIIDSVTSGATAPAPQIDAAEVFSKYWSLVLMCAQRFEGDPVYIGEDTAEILFPLDPSDAATSNEEKKAECQRRALTFALTLRQDFKAFSLHPSIRTKDYLQIHTGVAFGKLKLDIVGGVLRRCRAVPSGETVAWARELATCAINNQVLAHTSVEFVKRHAQLSTPFVRIGKDANLATRLLKELSTWPDAGHEAAYTLAGGRTADRRVSRELSFADKSSNFSALAKEAVQGDDLRTRSDFHSTNIEVLARFSPYSVLAKVARGSFAEKLDTAQGTVIAVLADARTKDLSADYDRVSFLQTVTLIAQRALIFGAGEVFSVKLEKSRVLLIAHFRNEQRRGAVRALFAALRVARELSKLGFKASIGVSSGECRIGTLGNSFRHKHAVLGSVPHLATFLARRSISLQSPFVILDQATFVHLPASLSMRFGASKAFVQGFDEALQIFFPESSLAMGSENEERLELAAVRNELSLIEDIRFARVADANPIDVRRLIFDDTSVSLVDEIIAATADVEQAEIIHEIVQYVAVMAAVSPDIHVGILQSVLPDSCSDEDLALALRVLQVKLQVLRKVGHGVFWVNNSEKDFMPLYATLMPFFRKKAHFELARIYESRMGPPGTWSRSNEAELEILIGSHFGQAGAEHHMLACTYINKGLGKVHGDDERVIKLSLRCSDLAHSWRRTQVREAEDAAARAMFVVGINERKRGHLYRSFAAFVACLRSYHELAPLLGKQCSQRRACKLPSEAALADSPKQDACHCYSMTNDLHVGLLVHFAEDQYLRELHFRGMNLCLEHRAVVISPLKCVASGHLDETMTERMRDGVTLEFLVESDVDSAYHLATTEDSDHKREYMRLVISSRQSAHLIFNALLQLASLSRAPKTRAKPRASEMTVSLQVTHESSSDVSQEEKSSIKSSFCVVQ